MSDVVEGVISIEELKKLAGEQPVSRLFGFKILELSPGYAKVSLKMKPEYLNFNGRVFGGIITNIADEAFAMSVSTVAHPSVASQVSIYFLAPAEAGDELIAEGRVIKSGKRLGFAEMTVTNQNGTVIAKMSGTYAIIRKKA